MLETKEPTSTRKRKHEDSKAKPKKKNEDAESKATRKERKEREKRYRKIKRKWKQIRKVRRMVELKREAEHREDTAEGDGLESLESNPLSIRVQLIFKHTQLQFAANSLIEQRPIPIEL